MELMAFDIKQILYNLPEVKKPVEKKLSFNVSSFSLFKSVLTKDGSTYNKLETYRLDLY